MLRLVVGLGAHRTMVPDAEHWRPTVFRSPNPRVLLSSGLVLAGPHRSPNPRVLLSSGLVLAGPHRSPNPRVLLSSGLVLRDHRSPNPTKWRRLPNFPPERAFRRGGWDASGQVSVKVGSRFSWKARMPSRRSAEFSRMCWSAVSGRGPRRNRAGGAVDGVRLVWRTPRRVRRAGARSPCRPRPRLPSAGCTDATSPAA